MLWRGSWSRRVVVPLLVLVLFASLLPTTARASSEITATDAVQNSNIKLSSEMRRDISEVDSLYDYYSIKATVEDLQARGPYYLDLRIWVPSYAQEIPTNHKPETSGTETWITFTYEDITFPILIGGKTLT